MITSRLLPPRQPIVHRSTARKPDFFLVGAPRCGTTAMQQYLSAHPDVYMGPKEMHFFGSDLVFGPRFYHRDREAYLAEYKGWKGQRRAGDASVLYLLSARAAGEIKAFNPEARILIMLREPVEMLYSIYHQFRFDLNENLPTFEEALAAEDERRSGRKVSRRAYFIQGLVYREIPRYAEQVRRYFEAFGRERVHVIIYDDFATDVAASYRRVLEFLDLDLTRNGMTAKVINGAKAARSPMLQALLCDPIVRSGALALSHRLGRPIFSAVRSVERRLCQLNTRAAKRPPLGLEIRARLKREFAPEVERLSELLRRDLTHWSR